MNYDIILDDQKYNLDVNKIENIISFLIKEFNINEEASFSISFVSKNQIHYLNKNYRNIDRSTDILTFCQNEEENMNNFTLVLGDIVICLEELVENCIYFKESNDRELLRLLIHGFLHLLGNDHSSNDVKVEPMLIEQEKILLKMEKEIEPEKRSKLFI